MQLNNITKRQAEFLAKSAKGMTYKQIADDSFVTINTVRSTFRNARERIGAATNTQAVVLAIAREELCLDHDGVCEVPIKIKIHNQPWFAELDR